MCNNKIELFISIFQSIDQLLSQDWSQKDKINIKNKIIFLKQEKCTRVLFLWEYNISEKKLFVINYFYLMLYLFSSVTGCNLQLHRQGTEIDFQVRVDLTQSKRLCLGVYFTKLSTFCSYRHVHFITTICLILV